MGITIHFKETTARWHLLLRLYTEKAARKKRINLQEILIVTRLQCGKARSREPRKIPRISQGYLDIILCMASKDSIFQIHFYSYKKPGKSTHDNFGYLMT